MTHSVAACASSSAQSCGENVVVTAAAAGISDRQAGGLDKLQAPDVALPPRKSGQRFDHSNGEQHRYMMMLIGITTSMRMHCVEWTLSMSMEDKGVGRSVGNMQGERVVFLFQCRVVKFMRNLKYFLCHFWLREPSRQPGAVK